MKRILTLLLVLPLVFVAVFASSEEATPKRTIKDTRVEFTDIVLDSIRLIELSFRGDEKVPTDVLFKAGKEALASWAAEQGEDALKVLDPVLSTDYSDSKDFKNAAGQLADAEFNWLAATDIMVDAMVRALHDPFSHYFTLEEFRRLINMIDSGMQDFYGFMPQRAADGNLNIVQVKFGSPAFYAGFRNDDKIVSVNGKPVSEYDRDELVKLIAPDVPNDITIGLLREGWPGAVEYTLFANPDVIPMVTFGSPLPSVGYVRTTIYGAGMDTATEDALRELKAKGAKAYILDLRNNPGGNANIAVGLCDIFLRGQKIATIFKMFNEDFNAAAPMLIPGRATEFEDVPLVCLINRSSASASEMTSGALQDHHRATIIGTTSYGKGCAQIPLGIPASRGRRFLYLTSAKYFLPSGRTIHKSGVVPDITVSDGHALEGNYDFALIQNCRDVVSYASKLVQKDLNSAKNLAYAKISTRVLDGHDSLRKKVLRKLKGVNMDCFEPALRKAIVCEYCHETRIRPAFDLDDAVLITAIKRLEYESGLDMGSNLLK